MTASENGPPWYIGHANDVSLAVAARDAAIERADQQMAARFAGEARDAIATAVKAGVTLDELAEEIGYPDGAAAMDGPHVDRQIADMHDNGPAFALGSLPESQEGWPRWLEVTEVSVGDDYVIEVVQEPGRGRRPPIRLPVRTVSPMIVRRPWSRRCGSVSLPRATTR